MAAPAPQATSVAESASWWQRPGDPCWHWWASGIESEGGTAASRDEAQQKAHEALERLRDGSDD